MQESQVIKSQNEISARVQIKICGLTQIDQAVRCADLGADLIGLVFYPGSPRCVDRKRAREIVSAVGSKAGITGVFVNASYRTVMEMVQFCGLRLVQLHGSEPPELVQRLRATDLVVLKALFHMRRPFLHQAQDYDASAFLLECGTGRLPGGNARVWKWEMAEKANRERPLVLAGGLNAENISRAIRLGKPDAVDVSSGVERAPGEKDMEKVAAFIAAVDRIEIGYHPKKIHEGEGSC